MTFMRGSALVGVSAGLFVLGFTLVWAFDPVPTSTPLDGAYAGNAVLALEFARSTTDVERVIGPRPPTPEDQAIRDRLDALNRHDHVYMLAYGGLLVAGFVLLLRVRRCALPALGAALVATGVAFDALENAALFEITGSSPDLGGAIGRLVVFTHVKWTALALATALYAALSFREGGLAVRASALVGLLAVPLAAATATWPETASVLLTLSFLPVWVLVFVRCARVALGRERETSRHPAC